MNLRIEQKQVVKQEVIPCEIYSRISGYFRPTLTWNRAKKEEFKDRRMLKYDRYPGTK